MNNSEIYINFFSYIIIFVIEFTLIFLVFYLCVSQPICVADFQKTRRNHLQLNSFKFYCCHFVWFYSMIHCTCCLWWYPHWRLTYLILSSRVFLFLLYLSSGWDNWWITQRRFCLEIIFSLKHWNQWWLSKNCKTT